ncbi:MAG: UDP-N-acetylmuramate dehydrogenase [Nitrospirae bacterium]|nr:UDP-N-acetylmuramate dehydrogenase [Nitrospirota bacterium]
MTLAAPVKKVQEIFQREVRNIRGEVLFDEPMSRHTSFRIGGPADLMVFPEDQKDLAWILRWAGREDVPLFILGGGCNLLVRDGGIRGVVVNLKHFDHVVPLPPSSGAVPDGSTLIFVGSGKDLAVLLQQAIREGWAGLEFIAGVPGALGGALIMNAGSYGGEIKDVVRTITIMDSEGNVRGVPGTEAHFKYRSSEIPGRVILGAVLEIRHGEPARIRELTHQNLLQKKRTQPIQFPSAGSIFKNPEGGKAWQWIDAVGMRGVRIGGAQLSEMHTNYIVNRGGATARDVMTLIRQITEKVERSKGLILELEVRIVGEE